MTRRGVAAAVVALAAATAAIVGWGTASTRGPDPTGSVAVAVAGETLDGETLFHIKGCASCHTGPDSTAMVSAGPDLSDAATWAGDRRPGMSAEDYVAESVRIPAVFISPAFQPSGGPTASMPVLELSDAEVDALVDYLLGN